MGDVLLATRECLRQAVRDKGRDWVRRRHSNPVPSRLFHSRVALTATSACMSRTQLNVYGKRYARHELDGLGRAVWYRKERGPLPSTLYEADGAWDSLFVARVPERLDKGTTAGHSNLS